MFGNYPALKNTHHGDTEKSWAFLRHSATERGPRRAAWLSKNKLSMGYVPHAQSIGVRRKVSVMGDGRGGEVDHQGTVRK